jgi:tetratricopeptide (TPR) repeat protein
VDSHNNLGAVFFELGKFQKAITCYQKAIQIQPNYAAAHYNLGKLFKSSGEYKKTISYYQKAIQINPNYAAA